MSFCLLRGLPPYACPRAWTTARGADRTRSLRATFGTQNYVGPDHGLVTLMHMREVIWVANRMPTLSWPRFWIPEVSRIFHG